jgi:hypothetical protein
MISYTIHQQPGHGPEFSTTRTLTSKLKTYPEELISSYILNTTTLDEARTQHYYV